jgi:RNA polymerase-interacting CarD/CdnL/TRCF family regulator
VRPERRLVLTSASAGDAGGLGRTPPIPTLAVGDLVVYASHGIGRVESLSRRARPPVVVLSFEGGLRVTLPLERASQVLRPLSSPEDLDDVRRTLNAIDSVQATDGPWSQRDRAQRQAVAAGTIRGLAEVVRDGIERERRMPGAKGGSAARGGQDVYAQARRLLAAEIAACTGVETAAADEWIAEQAGPNLGVTDPD